MIKVKCNEQPELNFAVSCQQRLMVLVHGVRD